MHNTIIIIPAYQPDKKLIALLEELKENNFANIVLIDEGSGLPYSWIFTQAKELGCFIIKPSKNKGQKAILKAGIKFAIDNLNIEDGLIILDAHETHKVFDIIKIANLLKYNPNFLILDKDESLGGNTTLKSYLGSNKFKTNSKTSKIYTKRCLLGIPRKLIKTVLKAESSHKYEYHFIKEEINESEFFKVELKKVCFRSKEQISKIWKLCSTLFFTFYFTFTLLNRFVISQNVIDLGSINSENSLGENTTYYQEDTNSGLEEDVFIGEAIITQTSYKDENIQVSIDTIREYDTDIYIADIIIEDSSYLMAGLAQNSFGGNVNEKTSVIASENDAIIAINGDYYGFRDYGYVMRNGYLYRDIQTPGGNESLVIFSDGNMEIIEEEEVSAQELSGLGAMQIFSFGPGLISQGEVIVNEESKVDREDESNPRTAIAMIQPNHYIFMVADGRTEESEGLSLYEMAQVLSSYDCEVAYNLDGGGSATMVFMGEVVNFPTTNGKTYKERSVSDIVYIGK